MVETSPAKKEGMKLEIIVAIALIVIVVVASVYLVYMTDFFKTPETPDITYSTYYTNLNPEDAYDLINTSSNLTIIDCRGLEGCSQCQFNKGHLPGAELNSNPLTLYNYTSDILVYSVNGTIGEEFCEDLVNHVYGDIYNLEGGYEAWAARGFPKS
jgi:rhodanese-related sulfurtransferase